MSKLVPKILRTLRERKGWTQEQLSESTHRGKLPKIDKGTISRLERGEGGTSRCRTIEQLARALGVDTGVLTGDIAMPSPQPPKAKDALNTLIGTQHQNALRLVAWRYRVGIDQIVELAPYLFCWAAEASLNRRRATVAELEKANQIALNIQRNSPHLPDHDAFETTNEIVRIENESIDAADIFGFQIESHADPDCDSPFEAFLRSLSRDLNGHGQFNHFIAFDAPSYEICAAEAAELVANDSESIKGILEGAVSLSDLPENLKLKRFSNDFPEERAAWIKERAKEYYEMISKRILDQSSGGTSNE